MEPLTPAERRQIRSQFTMSLANLGEFRVYWLPGHRRITCRSISCTRQFRVPPGAVLVGSYSAPCSGRDFLGDLEELLERLPEPTPEPVTPPKSPEADPAKAAPAREAGAGREKKARPRHPPLNHPWRNSELS